MKNKFKFNSHQLLNFWFALFAAALAAYFLGNKPLYYIALNLRPIAFALVFAVSFCGFGAPFAQWLYPQKSKTDQILASFALGLGLTALFTFILGIFGIVNAMIYSLWALSGIAIFVYTTLKRWFPFHNHQTNSFSTGLNFLAVLIIVPFILQLIPPLVSPPVSTDALEYHLLIPKIFLKIGKIGYIPSLLESNYPCMAEYIYLLILPLAGDIVCKSIHFWTGIFLLFAMGRLIAKASPDSSRLLGPALFLSMPVAVIVFAWAWNDLFFVFFLLLSLGYLLDYHMADEKKRSTHSLLMAGIMAGMASWMKYTFVMVLFAFILLTLAATIRWKWKWQNLLWFFTPIGLISLLWFIKNWIFTGNPVYPFLHDIFPSPYWNDTAALYFSKALRRWEIPDWNWTTYFTFPFRLTLKPLLIDVHTGILPLVLAPMLFFRSPNKGVTFLKAFIVSFTVVWLVIQTETRSLLTLFAVFFCVAAIGVEKTVWSRKSFRRPFVFFLCLALLANLGITIVTNYHLTKPVRYFLGIESRENFLLREAESQPAFQWLNKNPGVNKVLLVGIPGPFYLEREAFFSSICDPPIAEVLSAGLDRPEEVRQKFLHLGINYVAVNTKQYEMDHINRLYSWSKKQRQTFEDFLATFCRPTAKFGEDTIYKIK